VKLKKNPPASPPRRLKATIRGAVQGVGFRPFVYRLATSLQLNGWVGNTSQGVSLEVEGPTTQIDAFLKRVGQEKPVQSLIQSIETSFLETAGYDAFVFKHGEEDGEKTAQILPDLATCPDCLKEIFNPSDRRYLYPFTNCIHCGPRFTIIEKLPYDRSNTTMKGFTMCDRCREEYTDPLNRRFHAQPNACPDCGPHVELWNEKGNILSTHQNALAQAAHALRQGALVAVKGVGGFHLMADASNDGTIFLLRKIKNREEKPFALMYPSLDMVKQHCEVSPVEENVLRSSGSPIVLLKRRPGVDIPIAPSVAPKNPSMGVMLPYSPLHHILLRELGMPVVATSGNMADEPICIDEDKAVRQLGSIAKLFLVHDRPILRHMDDSVVRVVMGKDMLLRRARGYAPMPVHFEDQLPPVLAVGAHLKNTVATSVRRDVFVSQHIGDLATTQAFDAFQGVVKSFRRLYSLVPSAVIHDEHPQYLSTRFAQSRRNISAIGVQHHYAHVLSCMGDNDLKPPVLGIAWDGVGLGTDGTLWGGEFIRVDESSFHRVASLRPFSIPGNEKTIQEPRRAALGVLYDILGDKLFGKHQSSAVTSFTPEELDSIKTQFSKKTGLIRTSSMGRLFDAVASLTGLCQVSHFEAQAAMQLEYALEEAPTESGHYPFELIRQGKDEPILVDWHPMMRAILDDIAAGVAVGNISKKFHNALAEMAVAVAEIISEDRIALTGGCFQNKYLSETTIGRLRQEGFTPHWHQKVPANDGGIALGQVMAAARLYRKKGSMNA